MIVIGAADLLNLIVAVCDPTKVVVRAEGAIGAWGTVVAVTDAVVQTVMELKWWCEKPAVRLERIFQVAQPLE